MLIVLRVSWQQHLLGSLTSVEENSCNSVHSGLGCWNSTSAGVISEAVLFLIILLSPLLWKQAALCFLTMFMPAMKCTILLMIFQCWKCPKGACYSNTDKLLQQDLNFILKLGLCLHSFKSSWLENVKLNMNKCEITHLLHISDFYIMSSTSGHLMKLYSH